MNLKICALLLLVAGLIALAVPGQDQKKEAAAQKTTHKQRELPILDFPDKASTAHEPSSREKAKASRYDRQSSQPIQEAYHDIGPYMVDRLV